MPSTSSTPSTPSTPQSLPPTTILPAGTRIGPYEIVSFLARGGMGVVYLARHTSLKDNVALKVLYPHLTGEGEFAMRFQREGAAMAKLRHPNIAQVLNAEATNSYHFLAMEFAPEGTLRNMLDRTRQLPVNQALAITQQMAAALQHAHSNGIIHRDIKPSNILCAGNNRYLLTDFGVAQIAAEPKITKNLATMGTPEYMSPEQGQGLRVDGRSDLYSLGIVLYEMLAGRPPFSSETHLATLFQHAKDTVPPIQKFRPDTPVPVRNLVNKLLAKNPKDRYQTAAELLTALTAAMQGKRVAAKSNSAMLIAAGVAVVSLGLAGILIARSLTAATPAKATPTTVALAAIPTAAPTATLAQVATEAATQTATAPATEAPTAVPTSSPSPTLAPTLAPTATPEPTLAPTTTATESPTEVPTEAPTEIPTVAPTDTPQPTRATSPTPAGTAKPSPTPKPTSAAATVTPAAVAPASVTLSAIGAGAERRNRPPQWDQGNPAICSFMDAPGDPNRELIWRFSMSVTLKNSAKTEVTLTPRTWALKAQNGYVMRTCLPASVRIPAQGEANVSVLTFFEKDKLVPYRLELVGTKQAVCFVPVGNVADLSRASLSFAAQKCQ